MFISNKKGCVALSRSAIVDAVGGRTQVIIKI
jgi:hypothetical protein